MAAQQAVAGKASAVLDLTVFSNTSSVAIARENVVVWEVSVPATDSDVRGGKETWIKHISRITRITRFILTENVLLVLPVCLLLFVAATGPSATLCSDVRGRQALERRVSPPCRSAGIDKGTTALCRQHSTASCAPPQSSIRSGWMLKSGTKPFCFNSAVLRACQSKMV